MQSLTQRQREVLSTLIKLYLNWGEPVASADIADALNHKWSSATIRKDLKILEDMGFLEHPYKVAGRYPTVKAYRWFFNNLKYISLWDEESVRLFKKLVSHVRETAQVIQVLVRELSVSLHEMSLGTYVPKKAIVVDMVFPKVDGKYIVGLLLSTGEFVKGFVDLSEASQEILSDMKKTIIGCKLQDIYERRDIYPSWFSELIINAMQVRIVESGIEYIIDKTSMSYGLRRFLSEIKNKERYIRIMAVANNPVVIFSEEITDGKLKDWMMILVDYSYKGLQGLIGLVGPIRYNPERFFETLLAAQRALEEDTNETSGT